MAPPPPADPAGTATTDDLWDRHAAWWQEHFTDGADPEYEEQILPLARDLLGGAGRVLDAGCGEGQLARVLAGAGAEVIGADLTMGQVEVARRRGGGPRYVQAALTVLPFAPAAFDAAVVCLVLEHVDDLDAALGELARVVRPGGRVVLFLNHPLLQTPDSGWVDDHVLDPPERYWRVGPYLEERTFVDQVEPGVHIRFVHRPLHRYVNGLSAVGLQLVTLLEPPPPAGFLAVAPEYVEARSIPRLLVLVTERRAAPAAGEASSA